MARAFALVFLLLVAQSSEPPAYLPGTAPEDVAVVQVLDANTGEPIAGARVALWSESIGDSELLASAETDDSGIASVGSVESDGHWVFDAPGYAVTEEYGVKPPETAWLAPGETIEARLFDPFGEPAAGVAVGMHLGCGHSPTVRTAVTDADGRFRMEDVSPGGGDFWFVMEGATSNYFLAQSGEIHPLPGTTVKGVLRDMEGEPVGGAVVESLQRHRGPRTRTGPDGSFTLRGVDPGEGIRVRIGEREVFPPGSDELRPWGVPARPVPIVLPSPDLYYEEALEERYGPFLEVPIRAPDLPDEVVAGFLHVETGLVFFAGEDLDGGERLAGPPGTYEILPGPPFQARRITGPTRFRLDAETEGPIVLETEPRPVLDLVVKGPLPTEAELVLIVPGNSRGLFLDEPETVHLPADVRAAVRVEWEGHVRHYPVGPIVDGRRAATVEWPEGLEPIEREGSGGFVSLGAEQPGDGPVLLLLDAEGKPLAGRTVRITRLNAQVEGSSREDGSFPSLADGVVPAGGSGSMSSGPRSSAFLLEVKGYLPRAVPGTAKPPITVRYPAGRLDFEVVDEFEAPLDFTAVVDGRVVYGKGGRLELRGIPAGEHRVAVGAAGHGTRTLGFATGEGEVRPVRVKLITR